MSDKYQNCELLYEDGANNISRVVQLEDGSLFTLANLSRQLRNMGSYPKHQFVFSRKSFDGGKTWTMPTPLFEIPETKAYVRALPFLISKKGYLHIFLLRIKVYDFENNKFEGDILHARMDDFSGKNLKIQKIECLDRYTGALNNLIQLNNGRIVVPFSTLESKSKTFVSNTIYSDDEGITWSASNDVKVVSEETHVESGAVEPVITEVADNKLVMIIRTVLGCFYYSVSYDGGASWSMALKSEIKSSNAPAVLQKMKDGRILIIWNNCNGAPMRGVRYSMARQCLHVAVSDDGLKTIRGLRVIVKKEKGDPDNVLNCYPYADVSLNNEALIRLITVQSKENEDWNEPNAKLIKLSVDFLEETKLYDDFSSGTDNWVTDYSKTEVIESDNQKTLHVESKQNIDGYAMINFPYGQKGKIEIQYETSLNFKQLRFILADNYIDKSSFTDEKENENYRKFIDANFIDIEISKSYVDTGCMGKLIVSWDCLQGKIRLYCNSVTSEFDVPQNVRGFNHAGIILPKGIEQSFVIKEFTESSEMAWLETGIEY